MESSPIYTALVTARNFSTHERVLGTLEGWGVRIDEAFFKEAYKNLKPLKLLVQIYF